jgi:hypothetical protein
LSSLNNVHPLHQPCPIKLPNGDIISITHTDTLHVSPDISLSNFLYVPSFKLIYCPLANSPLLFIALPYFVFYILCFSGPINEEGHWKRWSIRWTLPLQTFLCLSFPLLKCPCWNDLVTLLLYVFQKLYIFLISIWLVIYMLEQNTLVCFF